MSRRLLAGALVATSLVAAAAVPAAAHDAGRRAPDPARPTITEIVAASGGRFDRNWNDYDILLNAVQAAGLGGALGDPAARLTVFAPDDLAFVLLARDLGYGGWDEQGAWDHLVAALTSLGGGDPIPVLTDVLRYHVSPGVLRPLDVLRAREIPTLLGPAIGRRGISLVDAEPDLRDPRLDLFALDRRASNGVVHGITRVLVPVDLP